MYNRNLYTSPTPSTYAHIHTLPSELIGYIFLLSIASNKTQPSERAWTTDSNALARLGVLHLVCTWWRDISLTYRVLWSMVSIHLTPRCRPLSPEFLVTVLERSGNANLSVDIKVGAKRGRELSTYLTVLQSHMHRMVEFKVKLECHADVRYVFPLEHPMPRLAQFCAVVGMEGRTFHGSPRQLSYYLPYMWHPGDDNETMHRSTPTSLDALHIELDIETLISLPQHVMGIRRLCLGTTDTINYRRIRNEVCPPVSIRGTYSLRLLDTAILDYNFHFPDVVDLVIDSQRAPQAAANLEGAFPAARSLSLGPLGYHDACFVHTCVELIKQTRDTVTELRFYGEYGVAQILQRAYADGQSHSGLCTPMALRQVVVERMDGIDERKDIRLYAETRQDLRETIACLLSHSQDVAIAWNHGLRRDVSYSAFTSDMKAMCLEFPGRLVWSV